MTLSIRRQMRNLLPVLLYLGILPQCAIVSSIEVPIEGVSRIYLDGSWLATGRFRTFTAAPSCFNGSSERLPNPSDYPVDWATNADGLCGTCHYEEDTDYGARSSTGVVASGFAYAPTPQQCCEACGSSPSCAVAVWHKSATSNHWTGKPEGVCILK